MLVNQDWTDRFGAPFNGRMGTLPEILERHKSKEADSCPSLTCYVLLVRQVSWTEPAEPESPGVCQRLYPSARVESSVEKSALLPQHLPHFCLRSQGLSEAMGSGSSRSADVAGPTQLEDKYYPEWIKNPENMKDLSGKAGCAVCTTGADVLCTLYMYILHVHICVCV